MGKPVFNPTQYELRNQLPAVVSEEQAGKIAQATSRVNEQLNWVAQILGWNGANYWDSLTTTVHQKRALLGGTYGVYNAYTLLPLQQIRTWDNTVVTDWRPNIAIGQRVIIGDQQTYIYDLSGGETEGFWVLNLGTLSDTIISYLEQGASIKVDCPENRPFPFYRPTAEASADAYFRCSVGSTIRENEFYRYANLILSPFDQNNVLIPYKNLCLFAGSYYYFDRAVTISFGSNNFAPWLESQWIESSNLWQVYIPEGTAGNQLTIVWDYALENTTKRIVASTNFQVLQWTDPSDWGNAGEAFNPVLDKYYIENTYNTAGLNYSLGTRLSLGDEPPQTENPLWYDAGTNKVYALIANEWVNVGLVTGSLQLTGENAPPPATYEYLPGSIWQDPTGQVYIWDAGFENYDFFYYYPTGIFEGFFYIDPTYQSIQGLYYYDPSNLSLHCPDSVTSEGFIVYNLPLNEEGFYISDPCYSSADWFKVEFYDQASFNTLWTPAYSSNLFLLVNGSPIPNVYRTANYIVEWNVSGSFITVSYEALSYEGEVFIPTITVGSFNGTTTQYIDITNDYTTAPGVVTTVPYNEIGALNNFRGAWGNKGGARSMDFAFDALDIHGYNEQQALMLEPINQPISFDYLLQQVSGSTIYTGDSPPPSAKLGDYYWNNETGALSVRYMSRDQVLVWVEVNYPISPCQIGTPDCQYFPLKPFLSSGVCSLTNGDTWKDPGSEAVALYYDSPTNLDSWVELNWNQETGIGWQPTQFPSLVPDFEVIDILVTDDFIPISAGQPYTTEDYTFFYTVEPLACTFTFHYEALSPAGVQSQPRVFVAINSGAFPPQEITNIVYSNANWYLAPAVQNSEWTLRPWKTISLEVTNEEAIQEDTFYNGLRADINLGPGDESWTRSFIRLPSEYGRKSKVWNQTQLVMQDFAYFGSPGKLEPMKCPTPESRPQIYEEIIFYNEDPSVGSVIFSAPYWYSDVDGFNNLINYFPVQTVSFDGYEEADFDFVIDAQFDEWNEADLSEYDPLHYRQVLPGGDWNGVYVEPTGSRPLSGFLERDLRVKSIIPVPAPVWDASIYKYPPLCPQGPESYVEDPNNYKVNYAYFAADLSASEDGFFDQSQDVAWREPLVEDQTLYILNN